MKFLTCFYEMGSRNARRSAQGFTLRCSKYTTFEHSKNELSDSNTFMFRYPCSSKKMIFIMQVLNQRRNYLTVFYSKQEWNSVAPAWQKWWKTIERGTEGVSRRLVELVEIKPGSRVLDIATGIGEPALTAANQVGKSGHVLATDISPQMLSFAKQRAISLGLQDVIEFKEGDAETIDLPPSTFDARTMQIWIDVISRL